MSTYMSRDYKILKSIIGPESQFEHKIDIPEFTFLGAGGQPDFGNITIWFYANKKHIELKSLKQYIFQWRDTLVSYERVINCIYEDLLQVYDPDRIRIEIVFKPRGGISSTLVIDSDWEVRGGSGRLWMHHK